MSAESRSVSSDESHVFTVLGAVSRLGLIGNTPENFSRTTSSDSSQPSSQPASQHSGQLTGQPSSQPTSQPLVIHVLGADEVEVPSLEPSDLIGKC